MGRNALQDPKQIFRTLIACGLLSAAGCATNPVTGRYEIPFVSESREVQVGEANYGFYQQAQGGAYITHAGINNYVRQVAGKLWAVSDRPQLPFEVVILNNSAPNAWALPGGKMAINRGLLTEMASEAELAAVIGHEIVHIAARHGAKSMEFGILSQIGVGLIGIGLAAKEVEHADLITGSSGLVLGLAGMKYGRTAELEADRYGIKYMAKAGYNPQAAVTLQETFLRLSEGNNQSWLLGLFASHPPSQERVDANRETIKQYPAGGAVGRDAYKEAMAPLIKGKAAYDKLDEGYKALAENKPERALTLAREALRIEPREALAHGLAGRALAAQHLYPQAIDEWNRAIEMNNAYYAYYLRRGQVRHQLGERSGARKDLLKSIDLLPTASAHYLVGMIALDGGDLREAKEHLRIAATSDASDGEKAKVILARLELADAPERYLQVGFERDGNGYLVLVVANPTALDIAECTMGVHSSTTGRWEAFRFPNGLPARRTARLPTRVGPFPDADAIRNNVNVRFDNVVVPDAINP